ncbi:heme o synthase [Glaciecola siphonariae]|uniref:Protoheme IX farnesyltransferase n=1 Tax=Glaciecola siphonariae TaxID=521012 RepID=A0ABV9LSK3_9ALTE
MNKTLAAPSKLSSGATWRDYYELTKPRVVMLLLLTALVGMCLATPTWVDPLVLSAGMFGIGLLSSAAAVINHVVDHRIDSIMARTFNRPVAKGKVSIKRALIFAGVLGALGFVALAVFVNMLTAWLTLVSLVGYAVIYTMYLKRATPQNIVIGGLAGAAPPLLGWTAVSGEIHAYGLLLVLIVFTWTPPHFWALAIHREKDYAKAKIPMLPNTHGVEFTKTCVVLYTLLLCAVCLLPYLTGMSGGLYLLGSSLLNAYFMYMALKLKFKPQASTAMDTFKFSILHLMLLFVLLLVDHYL